MGVFDGLGGTSERVVQTGIKRDWNATAAVVGVDREATSEPSSAREQQQKE